MKLVRQCLSLCVLCLFFSAPVQAADIDTITTWDGISSLGHFGVGEIETFGQTITATATERILSSFSFKIEVTTGPLIFQAYVYEWDGTKATGAQLYQSATMTLPQDPGVFQDATFNTPALSLTPGKQYVLFGSVIEHMGGYSKTYWGSSNTNPYPGGKFVFLKHGGGGIAA